MKLSTGRSRSNIQHLSRTIIESSVSAMNKNGILVPYLQMKIEIQQFCISNCSVRSILHIPTEVFLQMVDAIIHLQQK